MKSLNALISGCFLLISLHAQAVTCQRKGVYELSLSNKWIVQSGTETMETMARVSDFAKDAKVALPVEPLRLDQPFIARRAVDSGQQELRILVAPDDPARVNISDEDLETLENVGLNALKQMSETGQFTIISHGLKRDTLYKIPVLKAETVMVMTANQAKVRNITYILYRNSMTLTIGVKRPRKVVSHR